MPSKTWATGRPKKKDYEACYTNPNGSITCEGAQKKRKAKAKAKAKAKKIKKTGGRSGRRRTDESTEEERGGQTAKQYKDELGKKVKDFTKEEKRIYNNLAKAKSRKKTGKN